MLGVIPFLYPVVVLRRTPGFYRAASASRKRAFSLGYRNGICCQNDPTGMIRINSIVVLHNIYGNALLGKTSTRRRSIEQQDMDLDINSIMRADSHPLGCDMYYSFCPYVLLFGIGRDLMAYQVQFGDTCPFITLTALRWVGNLGLKCFGVKSHCLKHFCAAAIATRDSATCGEKQWKSAGDMRYVVPWNLPPQADCCVLFSHFEDLYRAGSFYLFGKVRAVGFENHP